MDARADIPIFVINLDRRPDRLSLVARRLDTLGLTFERIAAIDAQSPGFAEHSAGHSRSGPIGLSGNGTMACALSHAAAWRMIARGAAAYGVVLEDDAEFSPAFARFLRAFAAASPGLDLVKLERVNNMRGLLLGRTGIAIAGRTINRLHSIHTGAAAYILSRRGAALAGERFPACGLPVDHFLFSPVPGSLFGEVWPYQVSAALVRQRADVGQVSDVSASRGAAGRFTWARALSLLRRNLQELAMIAPIAWLFIRGRVRLHFLRFE